MSTYILGFGLAVLRRGCGGGEPRGGGDAEPVSATLMYVYSHTHSVLAEMHLSAVFAHCRHKCSPQSYFVLLWVQSGGDFHASLKSWCKDNIFFSSFLLIFLSTLDKV